MANRVESLLRRQFYTLPLEEQIKIVRLDRPRPEISSFIIIHFMKTLTLTQAIFDLEEWLTACDRKKRLYCWPCLLFGASSEWSAAGVTSPLFTTKLREHAVSFSHIQNSLQLLDFKTKHLSEPERNWNHLVVRNRTLLTRVADTVAFLAVQKGGRRTVHPPSVDECIEAFSFISEDEDPTITEDAIFLLRNKHWFVECVVNAMQKALTFAVQREIGGGRFVSVILSGHGRDRSGNVLRSVILRFIKDGRACERFAGFYLECGDGKLFYQYLSKIVQDYAFWEKMVGLSVDGMCSFTLINSLQCWLSYIFSCAQFVPSHHHKFWDVIVQFLCYKEKPDDSCEIASFFDMVDSLVSFLKNRLQDVESRVEVNTSELNSFDSVKNPVVLGWIKLNRKELIRYLSVCEKRKGTEVFQVAAFQEFLSNYFTVFWLTLFIQAFQITQDIQRLDYESLLDSSRLKDILQGLNTKSGGQFDPQPLADSNADFFGPDPPETSHYFVKYRVVFDQIHAQVYCRLGHLQNLEWAMLGTRTLPPRPDLMDKIRACVRPDLAKADDGSGTFCDYNFSFLSVESELLQELRQEQGFYDQVVDCIVQDLNLPKA